MTEAFKHVEYCNVYQGHSLGRFFLKKSGPFYMELYYGTCIQHAKQGGLWACPQDFFENRLHFSKNNKFLGKLKPAAWMTSGKISLLLLPSAQAFV